MLRFGGEVLPEDIINDPSRWGELNLPQFMARNSKAIREPEILECARQLRHNHRKTGAIGFCFGGWGVFRLAAKGRDLVDAISAAHPSFLQEEEIEKVGVPIQIIAPEIDPMFTADLKAHCHQAIPKLGVAYDYQYFPGLEHAFAVRGNPSIPKERAGMERAKNAAVLWFHQWLLPQ